MITIPANLAALIVAFCPLLHSVVAEMSSFSEEMY